MSSHQEVGREVNRGDLGLPSDFPGRVREVLDLAERAFLEEYQDPATQKLPTEAPTIIYQQAEGVADAFPAASDEERQQLRLQARRMAEQWWSNFHDRYYRR